MGCDSTLSTNPTRSSPIASAMIPDRKVSLKVCASMSGTNVGSSAPSAPSLGASAAAYRASACDSRMTVVLSGPTCICLLDPSTQYMIAG
jgi:hypothetical protein